MSSPTQSSAARLRLMTDLKHVRDDPPEGTSASPESDGNLYLWDATIFGPEESEWEGGIFPLKMKFSDEYPARPPKVRFTSEMFHPNIYGDGLLCLDILQSLLSDPNSDSPANPAAAALFKNDIKEYKRRVRKLVERSQESGFFAED